MNAEMLDRLKRLGFDPTNILDLGACNGEWTELAHTVYPDANYVMVDAIAYGTANKVSQKFNAPLHKKLLSDEVKLVEWYEGKNTGDSMYKELTRKYEDVKPVYKETTTLDRLFLDQTFNLIKIDCQGAEIPIIKGGPQLVKKAEMILLEVPLSIQFNKGVPDFLEHIKFMDSIGFIPFDVPDIHRLKGLVSFQLDILFIRKDHEIVKRAQEFVKDFNG